jgi:hypothetical protein
VSTETHFSAPTHVAPAPARVIPGRAPYVARRNGSAAIPTPASPETGSLSWNHPTSGDLTTLDQPQPRLRQLMTVCGWAAILGGLGLVIGIRGFIGDLMGLAPRWYEPAMIIIGIVGIGLTVGAFITVHRQRLPYALLGAATAVLLGALGLTVAAF